MFTSYSIITDATVAGLAAKVNAALATSQPLGQVIYDYTKDAYVQVMTQGTPNTGNIPDGAAVIQDGDTSSVEPTGVFADTVTFAVTDGVITGIALS